MKNPTIGYIICETASSEPRVPEIIDVKNDRAIIETILQDANVTNRNKRFYSDKELFPALKHQRIIELLQKRNLFGEAGHPMSNDLARQQTIDPRNMSHLITALWTDSNYVKGTVEASPTATGRDFHNCVMAKCEMAFSLRALGSVRNTSRGAEVENLRIITWDWVIYPSHASAYQTKVITNESGMIHECGNNIDMELNDKGLFVPINNQKVINYIKESSNNISSIVESFEMLYNSIELMPNGRQVKLVMESGDMIMVNLETHIQNEIMDFCCK